MKQIKVNDKDIVGVLLVPLFFSLKVHEIVIQGGP